MTRLIERAGLEGPSSSNAVALVAETRAFLDAWQRILTGAAPWVPADVARLREQSDVLEARARAADVGGLAHHLSTCQTCLDAAVVDKARLAECLRNVSEVAWQLREELGLGAAHGAREAADGTPGDGASSGTAEERGAPERPAASPEDEPVSRLDALLGLRAYGGVAKKPAARDGRNDWVRGGSSRPPPLSVDVPRPLAVQALVDDAAVSEALARDLDLRLERVRQAADGAALDVNDSAPPAPLTPVPPSAPPLPPDSSRADEPGSPQPFAHTVSSIGRRRWWSGPALMGAAGVVLISALLFAWPRSAEPPASTAAAIGDAALVVPAPAPPADDQERLRRLLAQVHRHGGAESPELADLLDEEAALLGHALSEACVVSRSRACQAAAKASDLFGLAPLAPAPQRSAPSGRAPWLGGLRLPAIGVRDAHAVREQVEFHTQHAVGRERFQVLLFQCAAYQELFQRALSGHGLPNDLVALAMVESGCVADAESLEGGRGLWRLLPEMARAYRLSVRPGVIDERVSPTKATYAAARFARDLHQKFGSWELAIASWQLGPFAVLARSSQSGQKIDFWQLADAGRMPAATVDYVSKVQAFALILSNLSHFRFTPARERAGEVTADVEVPPGTRLGQVARAAGSSTTKIRELNPDLLGESIPDLGGGSFVVRVPKEGASRARASLARVLSLEDDADRCVPHTFDWGRQRFTKVMADRCRRREPAASR